MLDIKALLNTKKYEKMTTTSISTHAFGAAVYDGHRYP